MSTIEWGLNSKLSLILLISKFLNYLNEYYPNIRRSPVEFINAAFIRLVSYSLFFTNAFFFGKGIYGLEFIFFSDESGYSLSSDEFPFTNI